MADQPTALAHEAIYDKVEELLGDQPCRVLDVPAGEGALAQRLTARGYEVACCDLYPQIFKLEGIEITKGDLNGRLPFDDASFDAAICVEGLEHTESPANAFREFARVIKPGGRLIVSVPNIMNIEERLKWLFGGYTSHFKPLSAEVLTDISREFEGMEEIALHVNPIGYSEVRYLMENNGFRLQGVYRDRTKRNLWLYYPLTWAIRLLSRLSGRKRRQARWADELNSDEVLLGGNTLIFSAEKL